MLGVIVTMKKIKDHEALFIFSLTGLGYLCTYIFQWGKFHYYSIPKSFIEINSNTLLSSLVFMLILLMLSSLHVGFIKKNTYLKSAKNILFIKASPYNRFIQFLLVCMMVILGFMGTLSDHYPYYLIGMILLLVLYFLLKNYQSLFFISYIGFILCGVFTTGYSIAENETTYLVIDDPSKEKSYVVLNIQNGKAIIAEMSEEENLIYPNYQLLKIEADKLNEHVLNQKELKDLQIKKE